MMKRQKKGKVSTLTASGWISSSILIIFGEAANAQVLWGGEHPSISFISTALGNALIIIFITYSSVSVWVLNTT
jgi:hypothetical protein